MFVWDVIDEINDGWKNSFIRILLNLTLLGTFFQKNTPEKLDPLQFIQLYHRSHWLIRWWFGLYCTNKQNKSQFDDFIQYLDQHDLINSDISQPKPSVILILAHLHTSKLLSQTSLQFTLKHPSPNALYSNIVILMDSHLLTLTNLNALKDYSEPSYDALKDISRCLKMIGLFNQHTLDKLHQIHQDTDCLEFMRFSEIINIFNQNNLIDSGNINDILSKTYPIELLVEFKDIYCYYPQALDKELLTRIFSYSNNPNLIQSLNKLTRTNLLNAATLEAIIHLTYPDMMISNLQSLKQAGILNQANITAISKPKSSDCSSALLALHQRDMLNDTTRQLVSSHASPNALAFALLELNRYELDIKYQNLMAESENPKILAQSIVILFQNYMLDTLNLNILSKHQHPSLVAQALVILKQAKLLNLSNQQSIIDYSKIDELLSSLHRLQKTKVLDQDLLNKALTAKSPYYFSQICIALDGSNLLNKDNLILIREINIDSNPSFSESLRMLNDAKLLNQNEFKILLNIAFCKHLEFGLRVLSKHQLLNRTYLDLIKCHVNPRALAEGLCALHEAKLTDNQYQNLIIYHHNPPSMANGLVKLNQFDLLNPDNITAIIAHKKPETIANLIKILTDATIFNSSISKQLANYEGSLELLNLICERLSRLNSLSKDRFQKILTTKASKNLCLVLHILMNAELLNHESLDLLLDERHAILLTNFASLHLWSILPTDLLTRHWRHIFTLARAQHPEQTLLRWVLGLLNGDTNTINSSQSTHTQSVHLSISNSASKLKQRYQMHLDGMTIGRLQNVIDDWINDKADNSIIFTSAKRALKRIISENDLFEDPVSKLSTQELVALIYFAAHDQSTLCDYAKIQGATNPDDNTLYQELNSTILTQFIHHLFEIQRGYNLSDTEQDDGLEDKPICQAGTFNKLMQTLQGIHPDTEIVFITKLTASHKLLVLIKEESLRFLSSAPESQIDAVKQEGIQTIWDNIKDVIAKQMIEEFGSLYQNDKTNKDFVELLHVGRESVELTHEDFIKLQQPKSPLSSNIFFSHSNEQKEPSVSPSP